jgi:hypothetical protein
LDIAGGLRHLEILREGVLGMRPDDGRLSLWPVGVFLFIVVLAVASITPVVRLNTAPPSDFSTLRSSAKGSDAAVAAGYWKAAETVIQWKYSRASALPEPVPVDFKLVDDSGKGTNGESQAVRTAYWAKLREEWLKADNWHTTYSFDLGWMLRNVQALLRAVTNFVRDRT